MVHKFLLLSWKNWLLQWRHPVQSILNIFFPLLFCGLLMLLRNWNSPIKRENSVFPPYPIVSFPTAFSSSFQLLWSPCNNTALRRVMIAVAKNCNMKQTCARTSFDLNSMLKNNISTTLAAVDFGDHAAVLRNISKETVVTLRYPAELRSLEKSDKSSIKTWCIDLLYPKLPIPGPRNFTDPTGPEPNYFKEGFLKLQHDISIEITKYLLRNVRTQPNIPTVMLQRFPHPVWFEDDGLMKLRDWVGAIFYIMFIPIVLGAVKDIADEKGTQLKEVMEIMGLPNCLHWTAWFFKIFVLLLIINGVIVFFFKVPEPTVLMHTNAFALFLFLTIYSAAVVTFCFLISVFFSKARTAMIAAVAFWYFTFVPFAILQNKITDVCTKLFAMLGLNTAVSYGLRLIIIFEQIGEGFQFSNMFTSPNPVDNLTMGHVIIMLCFDAILYFILAVYLEGLFPGQYGISKPWYYPCISYGHDPIERDHRIPESDTYQRGPIQNKALIQVRNLTKIYHNQTTAVHDLSMDMFHGQVTVIFGRCGSGKTTTLLMLTGTIPPTRGTAIINGYNVMAYKNAIRSTMSYCPQHTALFNDLTVREHLYFFSKLKGMNGRREIDEDVEQYLQLLGLTEEENTNIAYLPGVKRRKLSVGMALCGKPKICILDEPTSGIDPMSKRALWDFIQYLKVNRTIVISTNSMEEADYLGDRVAVLSNGQLKCYGTNSFLKQRYDAGYHLIIQKKSNCHIKKLTDFLRRYVPSIKVVSNTAFEVTYLLDKNTTLGFSKMLGDLEKYSEELRISNTEIAMSTMDEVFLKFTPQTEETNGESSSNERTTRKTIDLENVEKLSGRELKQNQIIALVVKKATLSIRSWIILVTLILLPLCLLLLMFLTSESRKLRKQTKLKISLDAYSRPTTLVASTHPKYPFYLQYLSLLNGENRRFINWGNREMTRELLEEIETSDISVRKGYIIGASFVRQTNVIIAWYNNQPYHSCPLSLQYVLNTILQEEVSEDYKITFVHYPLPYSPQTLISKLNETNSSTLEIPCAIGIGVAIVSALYVIICIKERISNSKHLQFVSGVNIYVYWLSAYLWDFCTFLVSSVCIIAMLFALSVGGLSSSSVLGPLLLLFMLFGLAMLPTMYLCSAFFQATASAFSVMALLNVLLGPITFMVYQTLLNNATVTYDVLHWISLLIPHYALTSGIYELSYKTSLNELCAKINTNTDACRAESSCCGINKKYLGWGNHGIGANICFLALATLISILLLLAYEYGFFWFQRVRALPLDDSVDYDVLEEKGKVRRREINSNTHTVVFNNLTKFYNTKLVVNQLCLGIKNYECFGMLGVKRAGKTTIFKMLTGATSINNGDAWIHGGNVYDNLNHVYKFIGYCPQVNALLDDLTGKETLTLYCMLKGISLRNSKIVTQVLAREHGFEEHLDKLVRYYGSNTRRKLSIAIALVGNPPVLLLDEPTKDMDASSRRKLWNNLVRQRNKGKCIILASQSMEECEALCTRMAIIVNGSFKCLGTPGYLKRTFSLGYTLTIILGLPERRQFDAQPVIDFVMANFPVATLKEQYQNVLTFFIITRHMKWSAIFAIMEDAKRSLNIEDYTIAQSSMEEMFLHFTKLQHND